MNKIIEMETKSLIEKFRVAFGDKIALPIAVSYTDAPVRMPEEKVHCMMHWLIKAKEGVSTSFSAETIYCRGGKVYSGYAPMNDGICKFVSGVERYKDTPENVANHCCHAGAPAWQKVKDRIDEG